MVISPEKLQKAHQLGAKHGTLYSMPSWAKEFGEQYGPFDVIVHACGSGGTAAGVVERQGAEVGEGAHRTTSSSVWSLDRISSALAPA